MKQNVSGGTVAAVIVVVLAVIGFFAWRILGKPKGEPPTTASQLKGGSAMQGNDAVTSCTEGITPLDSKRLP